MGSSFQFQQLWIELLTETETNPALYLGMQGQLLVGSAPAAELALLPAALH
jgi:hypothetical protein